LKYLLFYESAPDVREKAPAHREAHCALWEAFRAQGTLLMVGPFSNLDGALGIFTTQDAAEEFARLDPFVTNGVVVKWWIREWSEVLTPDAET
jgi:uncharacterized protein YciI